MEREFYDIQETALLLDCPPKAVVKLAKELGWKTTEDKYGRVISFPVPEVQKEAKRRVGEKARLQSMGIIKIRQSRNIEQMTTQERASYAMWVKSKHRAKKSGIEFDIHERDIIIPEVCPLLGTPLIPGGKRNNLPSLDRIDNTKGYIKGNVWVISLKANTMKQDASIEQLITFSKNVLIEFDSKPNGVENS